MMPFKALQLRTAGPPVLDQQVVTAGSVGAVGDRFRGYSTIYAIGSIFTGSSAIYLDAITELYHDEAADAVHLVITGATNTGWDTMTILGQVALDRTAAAFLASEWVWTGVGGNPFGGVGNDSTVQWT